MRSIFVLCLCLLAACAAQPASDAPPPATSQPPTVSGDGVVDYGRFRAIVARRGDTVATLAGRYGLSPTRLGAYNGLETSHPLRTGDELVLPPAG